ncbi:MAG TPA: hypothetical protein VFD41_01915 [Actinomycetales bacterium]|nr:hypothetical protein [Actinomycetales bacterium]
MAQAAARPVGGGDQVVDAVRAALAVPGVAALRVEPDTADGLALLRLELAPGANSADVARAVDEHLRRNAGRGHSPAQPGPAVGASPVPETGEPLAIVTSGRLPQRDQTTQTQPGHQTAGSAPPSAPADPRLRTSRGTQTHAGRPRPWEAPPVVLPDDGSPTSRLTLDRVQVMTRGLDVTATVVLTDNGRQHTGVCEAAATVGGHHRSLAGATAQALESAAGGRCRFEVEAADVSSVAGQETAVVVLSILSGRGTEKLTGACPVGNDPQQAVVKATLAASNRRMALQLVRG